MKVIVNRSAATEILVDERYASGRHIDNIKLWREKSGHALRIAERFFGAWPMFMDGREHATTRRLISAALQERGLPGIEGPIDALQTSLDWKLIDERTVHDIVRAWHRELFGLSPQQQAAFFDLCRPLISFQLHGGEEVDLSTIDEKIVSLGEWFDAQTFGEGHLLDILQRRKVSNYASIGLAMDTYEPVLCGLSSILYLGARDFAKHSNCDARTFVHECLRLYPPFRYIVRKNTLAEPNFRRTAIDLYSCNRDGVTSTLDTAGLEAHQSLTFGHGLHACPGARVASAFMSQVWNALRARLDISVQPVVSGHSSIEHGLCRVRDLGIHF